MGGQLDMAILHGELRHPSFQSVSVTTVRFAWVGSPRLVSWRVTGKRPEWTHYVRRPPKH